MPFEWVTLRIGRECDAPPPSLSQRYRLRSSVEIARPECHSRHELVNMTKGRGPLVFRPDLKSTTHCPCVGSCFPLGTSLTGSTVSWTTFNQVLHPQFFQILPTTDN